VGVFSFILINRRIVAKTVGGDENCNYKAGIVAKTAGGDKSCNYKARIVAKTAGGDESCNYKAEIIAKTEDQEKNCKYHTKKGQESEKDSFQNIQNESLTKGSAAIIF
jgi:hypothetical protein